MNVAVVSLGSNINPEVNISRAKKYVEETHILIAESKYVVTKPIGYSDQPDFLNGALLVCTQLDIQTFKLFLKNIEDRLSRIRTSNKNGPRTIDLDILIWNGKVIDSDIYNRSYLRKSVLQLLPDLSL